MKLSFGDGCLWRQRSVVIKIATTKIFPAFSVSVQLKKHLAEISSPVLGAPPVARRRGLAGLALLLVFWVGFSLAHLLQTRGFLDSEAWRLSKDGGYAEYFEYALLLVSSGAFFALFRRHRETLYLVIALILAYIAADNALGLHEAAGRFYEDAGLTSPIPHVRPSHFGQFLFLGAAGFILLAGLFLAARKAGAQTRSAAWVVAILIVGIGLFSAVVDTISDWLVSSELAYLEDSGELLMMVLVAAYSLFLAATRPRNSGEPSA